MAKSDSNKAFDLNAFTGNNKKSAGKKSDQGAPKPGSYAPPKAESAQHNMAPIADSAWSDRSYSGTLRSAQPASKFPTEATSSDNAFAKALLASDMTARTNPGQRRVPPSKPDIMR